MKCPNCQSDITDRGKFYKCAKCDFSLPKTYAGHILSDKEITSLITEGTTKMLTFKSTKQKGQTYQAKITMQDGKLSLSYPTKEDLSLGTCPACKEGNVVPATSKVLKCTKCEFKLWRTVYGKTLTDAQIKKLLKAGRIPEVSGLQYNDRTFSAPLVLESTGRIRAEKKAVKS